MGWVRVIISGGSLPFPFPEMIIPATRVGSTVLIHKDDDDDPSCRIASTHSISPPSALKSHCHPFVLTRYERAMRPR